VEPTLTSIVLTLMATVAMVFVLFLPSLLELKKPTDAGPRLIGTLPAKTLSAVLNFLSDLDEEPTLNYCLPVESVSLYFLPNMETYAI
jgi:hypothetical protein